MRKQRFTYQQQRQVVESLEKFNVNASHAAEEAMRTINYTEESIRSAVESVNHRSESILRGLDRGLNLNELGEYQSAPASVDMLIARRHYAYQTLVLLIGPDELKKLMAEEADSK